MPESFGVSTLNTTMPKSDAMVKQGLHDVNEEYGLQEQTSSQSKIKSKQIGVYDS